MTDKPAPLDARRRRLVWRATHRGMKELDLMLGGYARREARGMDEEALAAFEAVLDETDADLYDWLVRCLTAPDHLDPAIIDELRKIHFETDSYGNM